MTISLELHVHVAIHVSSFLFQGISPIWKTQAPNEGTYMGRH